MPSAAILLNTGKTPPHFSGEGKSPFEFFDPTITIAETVSQMGISSEEIATSGFNDHKLITLLTQRPEHYALFCGAGIIKSPTITAGPRLIHAHPGALPQSRGSTTILYNILEGKLPTVTTFFMEPGLDAGNTIHSANYALPQVGMGIGTVYDGIVRARTVAQMFETYNQQGEFFETTQSGKTKQYFVIHPALEALANAAVDNTLTKESFQ
jgi:methionyl-tRNA formyltransferase